MLKSFIFTAVIGMAAAECPNACSGHGDCSAFDMCNCDRNWQAADCSQRTCPFDLAHVDTPKGDINMDNALDKAGVGAGTLRISSSTVYPYGTYESYPHMVDGDIASPTTLSDTAHYYMECSNKGICDRKTGLCECFDGYDGAACQRASCPNDCSGHGTCETIADLAYGEYGNVYALWDKDASMGCKCDSGFEGADCSSAKCPVGVDPLYTDDTTARVATTTVSITADDNTGGNTDFLSGTYALKFYDHFGEDYVTEPIVTETAFSSTCTNVLKALKSLPDHVIAKSDEANSVQCSGATTAATAKQGVVFTITFNNNPGYLKQLEVDSNLEGHRATVGGANMAISVYHAGIIGEDIDYFATKCSGVEVTPTAQATWTDAKPGSLGFLAVSTGTEKALKACLGDSNGDATDNVDVENWDHGAIQEKTGAWDGSTDLYIGAYPHAVKTVPTNSATNNGVGEYHLVWYDTAGTATEKFRIANLAASSSAHYLYTTDGVVQQISVDESGSTDGFLTADKNETRVVGYFNAYSNKIYTNVDASCESGGALVNGCIEKGNKLFVVDGCWGEGSTTDRNFGGNAVATRCQTAANAAKASGVLYTVTRVYTKPHTVNTVAFNAVDSGTTKKEDRYVVEVDYNINFDGSKIASPDGSIDGTNTGTVVLFKFTPAATGNYKYVDTCSNRGACDGETGLCSCFKGYTGAACDAQNALAV